MKPKNKKQKEFLNGCVKAYAEMVQAKTAGGSRRGASREIRRQGSSLKVGVNPTPATSGSKPNVKTDNKQPLAKAGEKGLKELIREGLCGTEGYIAVHWLPPKNSFCSMSIDDIEYYIFRVDDFQKALAQARQAGITEGESHFHELIDKAYNNGRAEREAEMETQNKKIVADWYDIKNKWLDSLRSNELVAKQERERCVKAIKEEGEKYFVGNTNRIAAARFTDIILKRIKELK